MNHIATRALAAADWTLWRILHICIINRAQSAVLTATAENPPAAGAIIIVSRFSNFDTAQQSGLLAAAAARMMAGLPDDRVSQPQQGQNWGQSISDDEILAWVDRNFTAICDEVQAFQA